MDEASEIRVKVGLDWGDEKHVYRLRMVGSSTVEKGEIEQKPEALQEWLNRLRERAGGGRVAIALEHSRGALLYALLEYEFVVIYPINPKALSHYREAFYPSGGKDDPRDADLALDYLEKHPERIRVWKPESSEVRSLRLLTQQRRQLVDLRTELTNRLTCNLKNYFPQALGWAGPLKEDTACEFLERWPSLSELQKTGTGKIRRFFRGRGAHAEKLEAKLIEIPKAVPLTRDTAILSAGSLLTRSLVKQVRPLNQSILEYERRIAEVFEDHGDHDIFDSLPGCGPALGPRLLCLLGEDRDRYSSAEEVQTVSGIAPLIVASGKVRVVHWRWACPKFQRQAVHEFAAHSRHWCSWAQAFYKMQISRGKDHHMAVRALAFKWLRIIFVCWRDHAPYDDERYMESLKANNSPLLAYL